MGVLLRGRVHWRRGDARTPRNADPVLARRFHNSRSFFPRRAVPGESGARTWTRVLRAGHALTELVEGPAGKCGARLLCGRGDAVGDALGVRGRGPDVVSVRDCIRRAFGNRYGTDAPDRPTDRRAARIGWDPTPERSEPANGTPVSLCWRRRPKALGRQGRAPLSGGAWRRDARPGMPFVSRRHRHG